MVRGLSQGEFAALTPRQVVDGMDWPQFVALHLPAGKPDRTVALKPGERVLTEKEFREALIARRQKREAARGKTQ